MSGDSVVMCDTHSEQQQTLVCQHILRGLETRTRVGFFWASNDPDNPRPDAYCSACNERVKRTDGEWTGEALAHLKPQTLCGACYDLAKVFHSGGNPWM